MASFDIIKAVGISFGFLWNNRLLVLRMSLLPFLIKWIGFIFIISIGLQDNFLRQGLLLLPADFFEGWLVAYFLRLAIYKEDIFTPAADETGRRHHKKMLDHMLAGTLMFVLVNLIASLFWGIALMNGTVSPPPKTQEPSLTMFILAMVTIYALLWAVRLAWLHVPVVLGFSVRHYMTALKGLKPSVFMLATWIICLMPLALMTFLTMDILALIFQHTAETPSMGYRFVMMGIQSALEILLSLFAGIAMGLGIFSMLVREKTNITA